MLERRHITNQVEGLLIHVVVVTVSEASQAGNRGVQLHVLSGAVSEELGDVDEQAFYLIGDMSTLKTEDR